MRPATLPSGGAYEYWRPKLYAKQESAIFSEERIAVVEASTKAGKTIACMAWLLEKALLGPDHANYLWCAPIYNQAKMAFNRYKSQLDRRLFRSNEGELYLELSNKARLWFKGAERHDAIYGEDYYAAVVDEATRCRPEAWVAVRSTLTATQGPVRIIGNVRGRKNWAYQMARRAEAGAQGMSYARLNAYDAVEAGVFPADEVEAARRDLPPHAFQELYLAEPAENAGNPFGNIDACLGDMSSQRPVAWGIDLAKSVDWTVLIALDANGHICRFERFQRPWVETRASILRSVACPALVDASGVGDPVVEDLQRSGKGPFEGFIFTGPSKQGLMEGLAMAISTKGITYPEGSIAQELREFEYEVTRTHVRYSAPSGFHDDCVVALALAWRHFQAHRIAAFAIPTGVGDEPSYWRSA